MVVSILTDSLAKTVKSYNLGDLRRLRRIPREYWFGSWRIVFAILLGLLFIGVRLFSLVEGTLRVVSAEKSNLKVSALYSSDGITPRARPLDLPLPLWPTK